MVSKILTLDKQLRMDSVAAERLVRRATKFSSEITLVADGRQYNLKSIIGIMTMSLRLDEQVVLSAKGDDEQEAIEEISCYFEKE